MERCLVARQSPADPPHRFVVLMNGDDTAILRLRMEFIPRFIKPGRDHFFLLCPRGTGKMLWTRHHFPNALGIELVDPSVHREHAARPERLREMVDANPSRPQVEVDFVVYGESGHYALEVKNSAKFRPEDLRSLGRFGEDYPESRRFLLYLGKERVLRNEILCLPVEEFILTLQPGKEISP